jgi:hypothetical protein
MVHRLVANGLLIRQTNSKIHQVFDKIADLLDTAEYKHFTWVGSGLQKHYGHLTIARQDVHQTVDVEQANGL